MVEDADKGLSALQLASSDAGIVMGLALVKSGYNPGFPIRERRRTLYTAGIQENVDVGDRPNFCG